MFKNWNAPAAAACGGAAANNHSDVARQTDEVSLQRQVSHSVTALARHWGNDTSSSRKILPWAEQTCVGTVDRAALAGHGQVREGFKP
jgi:hypothetical protein